MEDLLFNNIDFFLSFFFFFFIPQGYNELCEVGKTTETEEETESDVKPLQKDNKLEKEKKEKKVEEYYNKRILGAEKNRWKRGFGGEKIISNLLLEKLPNDYYVFNDVKLSNDKKPLQIDHLVLSRFGLFSIETKNWYGVVSGGENEDFIQAGEQRTNPIDQNKKHIKELANRISIPKNKIFGIVCFANKYEDVKCIDIEKAENVCYEDDLVSRILFYQKIIISDEEVMKIGNDIVNTFNVGLNLSDIFI